jgi:hypothetical protein
MFSVIAPSTLVSALILLVFYLPLDAGERMSFSVTIFLTFSLFQVMVTDRLPNASGSTSILGKCEPKTLYGVVETHARSAIYLVLVEFDLK